MIETVLTDLLRSSLGHLRMSPNGWEHRNCPMCVQRGHRADQRMRFGINFRPDGGFRSNCFNCGFAAHWEPGWDFPKQLSELLLVLGVSPIELKKIQFQVYRENNNVYSGSSSIDLTPPLTSKWVEVEFPKGTYSFKEWIDMKCTDEDFLKCLEYIYNRGVHDLSDIYWNPLKMRQYNRRILFPFRYDKKLVGWSGRYYGKPASKAIPKYLNMMPEGFIYNLDPQKDYKRKYLLLFEGMLDAYMLDGVAALHDTLNAEQIKVINSLHKEVVLVPDRDDDGATLIKIAKENKWYVAFPTWSSWMKDASDAIGEYGKILTLESILSNKTNYSLDIHLRRDRDDKARRSSEGQKEGKD